MKRLVKSLLLGVFIQYGVISLYAQNPVPFEQPSLSDKASWSMVILPDLQNYVKFKRNQPLVDIMMNWIVENKQRLNIQQVLCTGDLVDDDDIINPEFSKTDQTGTQQWKAVSAAFGKLDGVVPYITCTGNHDYNITAASRHPKYTSFPDYFPAEKNPLNQPLLREVTLNVHGKPSLENAFYEWRSPHGVDFLFLSLEFAPRDTVMKWAQNVVMQPKYKDHKIILLTHSFLNNKNTWFEKERYVLEDANYGKAIWDKLVKPTPNFALVVSGHIAGAEPDIAKKHIAFRADKNNLGKIVNQMAFNAQRVGGGGYGSGGDGWLRILEFMPDQKTVKVKTFSPVFALSTTTQPLAWRKEAYDEFSFQIE